MDMLGVSFIPVLIVVVGLESNNNVDLLLIIIGCRACLVAFLLVVGHMSVKVSSYLDISVFPFCRTQLNAEAVRERHFAWLGLLGSR